MYFKAWRQRMEMQFSGLNVRHTTEMYFNAWKQRRKRASMDQILPQSWKCTAKIGNAPQWVPAKEGDGVEKEGWSHRRGGGRVDTVLPPHCQNRPPVQTPRGTGGTRTPAASPQKSRLHCQRRGGGPSQLRKPERPACLRHL